MSKYALYGICLQVMFAAMVLAGDASAQRYSVNDIYLEIDLENVSLEEAFKRIESTTEFSFNYNEFILNKEKKITLKTKNKSLGDLLKDFSKNSNLQFKRVNETIHVISKSRNTKPVTEVFIDNSVDVEVSGQVSDENGQALPGASIVVKGTSVGTTTDLQGNYKLTVADNSILAISFVGYLTQEVTVAGRSVIDINMLPDMEQLAEVVVTGYTSESKVKVTSALSSLDTKEALKLPVTNAAEAFQGRMAGVTVVSGGQPGDAPIVRIRGYGTTGNNNPLYIIDGVQLVSSLLLNDINVKDIESVTVLKDASAASIYGARASNGVVVINTRQGKVGSKPTITFDAYYGTQQASKLPDMVNSQQYGEIIYQTELNDGITSPGSRHFTGGSNPVLNDYILGDPGMPYDFNTNRLTRASQGTNWFDEIFESAPIENYYLSANGGSENGRYMISAGYFNRKGILLGTGFKRYSTRVNTSFNINDRLRVGEHFNVAFSEQNPMPSQFNDDNGINNAYRNSPLLPVFDEGGNYAGTFSSASELGNSRSSFAELDRARRGGDANVSLRFYADTYMEYDILKNLTAKSTLGVTYFDTRNNSFQWLNPEHSEARSVNTLTETNSQGTNWVWSNTMKYETTFNQDHNLSVLAGVEAVKTVFKQTQLQQQEFKFETRDFFVMGAGTGATNVLQGGTFIGSNTLFSLFAQAKYDYQGKYLFSGTIRRDRSSRFNKGNNTGVFPAFSAGWVLTEEGFLSSSPILNFLKVRASYGEMGNESVPISTPTISISQLNDQNAFYSFTGNSTDVGAAVASLGNADLTWETSSQMNIGADFGFFDDNLELTVEYFSIDTKDMILNPPLPSTGSVASPPYKNIGEMNNKGFEFELGYSKGAIDGALSYDLSFNLSTYKNEVTFIDAAEGTSFLGAVQRGNTLTRTNQGSPLSHFYGREVVGIFQNESEVNASASQGFETAADGVGRFRYNDLNGDNVIDEKDRKVLGSPHPEFTFGFNASVAFKGLDMSLFFSGVQGNEIYNYTKYFTDFPSFSDGASSVRVLDAWSPDNTGGVLPRLSEDKTVSNNENGVNSYFVEDGSYVRLKNLQIGYTLPQNVSSRLGLANARIYVQGTNVFTITDYDGLDPEIGSIVPGTNQNLNLGVDFGTFPLARTYTVGISLDF